MKKLITEQDIVDLKKQGQSVLVLGKKDILTPSAKDKLKDLGINLIVKEEAEKLEPVKFFKEKSKNQNKAVVASDHTGFKIKNLVSKILTGKGFQVVDVGTYDEKSCDYPDFAHAAALKVQSGEVLFGVIIDATGIPSAITANKLSGIRAATCYNEFSAKSAREHNNANILVLGAKTLGEESIKSILETWLNTEFAGGRHQRRLDKITAIESRKHDS